MSKPTSESSRWDLRTLALTEALPILVIGCLIARDGWNAANLACSVAGLALIWGGGLVLLEEFVEPGRSRRVRHWSYWFVGGGFVLFTVAVFV